MKVLAVADEEVRSLYDFYRPGMLSKYDLIISCGDLHREYLEFLVTMARCPLIYVRGNHDDAYMEKPPEGCICIEDTIYTYKGVRFLGLGGSMRYRPDGQNMYTEMAMRNRTLKLLPKILWNGGFDVLVAHAPARNYGDFETQTHRGFECFVKLIEYFKPAYFIHGHIHLNYGMKLPKERKLGETNIVNAYEFSILDLDETEMGKNRKKK